MSKSIPLIFLLGIAPTVALDKVADVDEPTLRRVAIRAHTRGYLVHVDGEFKFSKKESPETVWHLTFTKEGILPEKNLGAKVGPYLGVDSKKKQLAMFDKAGPTTIWQHKLVRPEEIRLPLPFEALLFMKLGDEELRLSGDERGKPLLGGKADIFHFRVEGG